MTELTAKQIHERILLLGATLALAFSGALPWWELDETVYGGWWTLGSRAISLKTQTIFGLTAFAMALLIGAALLRPGSLSAGFARGVAALAGVLIAGLCVLLVISVRSDGGMEVRGGLFAAIAAAGFVSNLWLRFGAEPWPDDEEPADEASDQGLR